MSFPSNCYKIVELAMSIFGPLFNWQSTETPRRYTFLQDKTFVVKASRK